MKYIIQSLAVLLAFASVAQADLPIYENVNYVKGYDMSLNENKIFISSPFAKPELNFPNGLNLQDKKIKSVTYLYSYNNENPTFAQNKLSNDRYANLMRKIGSADVSDTKWQTLAQAGCGNRPCSKELYHGFVVEFEDHNFLGHDNLGKQLFKGNSNSGFTVYGNSGTVIEVPPAAFVDAFGNEVRGEVRLVLQEAITTEDIVIAGLHTITSDEQMLESRGMINVEVFQGDNQLYLKDGKTLNVSMTTDYDEGFKYYKGVQVDGELKWNEPSALNPIGDGRVDVVEEVQNVNMNQQFQPVGAEQMMGFFPVKINYMNDDLTDVIIFNGGKKVRINEKKVNDQWLKQKGFDREEAELIKQWFDEDTVDMANAGWVVAREGNVLIGGANGVQEINDFNAMNQEGMNMNHFTENKLSNAFKMQKLGWANVDCLTRGKTEMISLDVIQDKVDDLDNFNISLVIPSRNIFIQGYKKKDGNYAFTHGDHEKKFRAPVGKEAYIVAMGAKDDKTFFDMKPIKLGELPIEHLALQPTSEKEALATIKKTL